MTTSRRAVVLALVLSAVATPAIAQEVSFRGVVTYGRFNFRAQDSVDAVLSSSSGTIYTAGAQMVFLNGVYVEFTAGKLEEEGHRVIVRPSGELVPQPQQPLEVTLRPIEVTGGWRYQRSDRFVPYGGAGYSRYLYQALSPFAGPGENVDTSYNGFHLVGGAEYLPLRWLAIGGEIAWSSVPDARPIGGVSETFDESNLGGTTMRVKISIGR
jgi:opacity protein-like surface antigen